ncbi:MAG: DNA polymerase III subunit delta', partial [Deltaproteobacteria bacterium]|nr:DNA polymerase III subunit delta' [Deltaproteobacteria bacterium]
MPRFADVHGQDRVVARLRAAVTGNRVHHAYLFTGPTGAGKRKAALALASALNCLTSPGEGCDDCDACSRIEAGIHPDVVTIEREGAAQIVPIESVRHNVIARVGLPPHEARVRVFLFDEATALQGAAANALLKTLEEPPARTMFILATTAPEQLLPTIRSRCQRVHFAARTAAHVAREAGDVEAAARLGALADELAAFSATGGARGTGQAIALAARICEGKGEAASVLELAAQRIGAHARAAAQAGDSAMARHLAARGRRML